MAPDQFLGGVALVRGEVRGAHLFCQKRGKMTSIMQSKWVETKIKFQFFFWNSPIALMKDSPNVKLQFMALKQVANINGCHSPRVRQKCKSGYPLEIKH